MQQWNEELAQVAQDWSEECLLENNPDRATNAPSFSTVGENILATSSTSERDYTAYVRSWFDNVAFYDYDSNTCTAPSRCVQYTQVNTMSSSFVIERSRRLVDFLMKTVMTNS